MGNPLESAKEKIIVILISIVIWFFLVPIFSTFFNPVFTFIPVILFTIIIYKLIEKPLNLHRLQIMIVAFLSFIAWLLSWGGFYVLPHCGYYLRFLIYSLPIECDCKGIEATIPIHFSDEEFFSHTVCIGKGKSYLGYPYNTGILLACYKNNCPENISVDIYLDSERKIVNCKTGVIYGENYFVDTRGFC